jgi:hypothetical protein
MLHHKKNLLLLVSMSGCNLCKRFVYISKISESFVLCGRDMVNEQRQYLVNPLVLPAFRVEGPMLQGEQLQSEARTTFLCHQKQFGLTAEIIRSNNAEQWI